MPHGRASADEASALRRRLERGEWRALLDPLVPLLLLSDPGPWWGRASDVCARELVDTLGQAVSPASRVEALEAWRLEVAAWQRPLMGWERTLREVERGMHDALSQAVDTVLIELLLGADLPRSLCRLAHLLADRLPPARPDAVTDALSALAVLDRFPAAS